MSVKPLKLERLEAGLDEDLLAKPEKKAKEKKERPKLWDGFIKKKKLKKPSFVAVIYLKNNGFAETLIQKARNGFFTINGKTYHERQDCTYTIGKERVPLMIIKEDQIVPYGTQEWDELEIREKFLACQEHAMSGIRHAERVRMGEGEGKPIGAKTVILIILGVLIAGAIMWGYR